MLSISENLTFFKSYRRDSDSSLWTPPRSSERLFMRQNRWERMKMSRSHRIDQRQTLSIKGNRSRPTRHPLSLEHSIAKTCDISDTECHRRWRSNTFANQSTRRSTSSTCVLNGRLAIFNDSLFIAVFGSILPSIVTIVSNVVSLCRVRDLNRSTTASSYPSRRRTDDTRRILVVISVECLFGIFNAWFSDMLLAWLYCEGNLYAGDDCPNYLNKTYGILMSFDMFNSISNIALHCICGKRFRHELQRVFKSWAQSVRRWSRSVWCCYLRFDCAHVSRESHVTFNAAALPANSSSSSNDGTHKRVHVQVVGTSNAHRNRCCEVQWYHKRRSPENSSRRSSAIVRKSLTSQTKSAGAAYRSLTQRTDHTRISVGQSMKLYHPHERVQTPTAI